MSSEINPYQSPQSEIDPSPAPPDSGEGYFSPEYLSAFRDTLIVQFLIAVPCLLLLDGGYAGKTAIIAMFAFWIGAVIVAVQRPKEPTETDLLFWRFGFIPCFVLAIFLRLILFGY